MIGSLFIRTYERGERVHQAMLARGYQGLPPMVDVPIPGQRDKVAISFTCVVALIGQAIYLGF
jgi:cobalt/nickel transport system permease protein